VHRLGGLQNTHNPLTRKPDQIRRFAEKACLFSGTPQPTNLGVRGSNPFGRANSFSVFSPVNRRQSGRGRAQASAAELEQALSDFSTAR
jgi:hypothetical protein